MLKQRLTINDATHEWVKEMNAFPYGMIERLMQQNPEEWREVTKSHSGDRVYVYENEDYGEIKSYDEETEKYIVELDNGEVMYTFEDGMEKGDEYGYLPMWGTLWQFGDSIDDYWLEELDGIRLMSECGFRIYEHEEWGYFFGIDGAGYDFYEAHWIPLYKARGLKWHDEETEKVKGSVK